MTHHCPTPINTNLGTVDWLEYLWCNKSWYRKIFSDVLEKVITILWAIWTHRVNKVINNDKCYPSFVLELTKKLLMRARNIIKCTNLPIY